MKKKILDETAMMRFGEELGSLLNGGEVIELIGDVGAGKTTLVKGLGKGLSVDETVQSPSFTISRVYHCRDDLTLAHYDFYRLGDAGIMRQELAERVTSAGNIVVVEWGEDVSGILPTDRLTIKISFMDAGARALDIISGGDISNRLVKELL